MMKVQAIRSQKRDLSYWQPLPMQPFGSYDPKRKMIAINTSEKAQEHLGFGGAFTEAAAYTYAQTTKENQEKIIEAYFDPETGLNYQLGRVAIHSCDFALGNYTYIEEGDVELETFDISHEDQWVIPMIEAAMEKQGKPLQMLASPWSPPAFMKTTKEMNYGGELLPEFAAAWAKYYVKFIEKMNERQIPIWGISIQNEPQALQCWDSCLYSAEQERDFIKNHLGPTLKASDYPDTAVIIWDHNRDILVERGTVVLSDPEAAQYVWGTGNHWYLSEDFKQLATLHHLFPDKHLLFTEGCVELTTTAEGASGTNYIGSWENGQSYGRNIIGDFNNWSEGWIDWNLLLNEQGGPNHVNNFCEAPIMLDRKTDSLMFNPSYYVIGHFSRYIQRGAKAVKNTHVVGEHFHVTSFENPDGSIVCVLQNEGWIEEVALVVDGQGLNVTVPDQSIMTLIFTPETM
ncbi:MAG: glycoside hydrolase family 30 protein [Culicoidibacterales bacterium]